MKIAKKIGFSFVWIGVILVMIWLNKIDIGILFMSVLLALLPWMNIDFTKIQHFSVDWQRKKLEINQALVETKSNVELTKKAAQDVVLTAESFSDAVNVFLKFNMLSLQREGRFNMHTPWEDSAKFLESALNLSRLLGNDDEETVRLIQESKCKVLELFIFDMSQYLPKDKQNELRQAISTGVHLDRNYKQIYICLKDVAINFEKLRTLIEDVPHEKHAKWISNVNKLEQYYKSNFK